MAGYPHSHGKPGLRFEDHTPLYEISNRAVNLACTRGTIYTANGVDGSTKFGNKACAITIWESALAAAHRCLMVAGTLNGKTTRAGFGIHNSRRAAAAMKNSLNLPFGILQQSGGDSPDGFNMAPPPLLGVNMPATTARIM